MTTNETTTEETTTENKLPSRNQVLIAQRKTLEKIRNTIDKINERISKMAETTDEGFKDMADKVVTWMSKISYMATSVISLEYKLAEIPVIDEEKNKRSDKRIIANYEARVVEKTIQKIVECGGNAGTFKFDMLAFCGVDPNVR